jgi:hypothetical protein
MPTVSEHLFKAACRYNRVLAWRLTESTVSGRRRPDFLTWKCFQRVAVEVKQFDPSPEDRDLLVRRARGEIFAYGGEPGRRVREAISDGSGQLRSETKGRWPGVLVVHDATGFYYHDDAYHILTAMFGLEAVQLEVPQLPATGIRRLGMIFSGKRRTTPNANRAISAVARLYRDPDGVPCIDAFHNPHASATLSARRWYGPSIRHFRLGPSDQEGRRGWIAI